MEIMDKLELLEKWWVDAPDTQKFSISQTTNSIYIKFIDKRAVRISDHPGDHRTDWIDINYDIWHIHNILLRITNSKETRKGKHYACISL